MDEKQQMHQAGVRGLMSGDEQLVNFRDLLRVLNEYKWGILSITVLTVLAALLVIFSITPTYQATVTILIEAKGTQPIKQLETFDPGNTRSEYYGTQFLILKSRNLAKRTVEKLDLVNHEEFKMQAGSQKLLDWARWLPFLTSTPDKESDAERLARHEDAVIDQFSEKLTVEFISGSQLIKAKFESEDPKLAALVANTLAELFIESSLEGRLDVTQKASSWLTDKLANIREDLKRTEQALQAFREQEQLVRVGDERGLIEDELTDNATRLREARKIRTELASTYAKIQSAGSDINKLEDVSPLLQSELVVNSKDSMRVANQDVKQLEKRYGPKHPTMISAMARLDAATRAYHVQLQTAARGIQVTYEIARDNERAVGQLEASARGTIRGLDRKQYQLRALERDVDTNRQLYDTFLTRFKETDLTSSYESLAARVVDPAVPPREAYKPQKKKILLIAAAGGLLLGVLFALLGMIFNDTIQSDEELEVLTGHPVLGVLPIVQALLSDKEHTDIILSEPKSGFAEGIRSLRTNIVISEVTSKKKRLIITSSAPKEGKTTVAINLAIAHAQIEKTLLLEGDLRRPSIASKLRLPDTSPGLIELLSGNGKVEDFIYRYEAGKLDILPMGKMLPNPAEILASGRFHQLLDALSEKYERIIIDSAPCHAVSDTYLLARNCDGLIFLVQTDVTSRRMIRGAIRHLQQANSNLIGTVVNQVDLKRQGHHYASYYYDYGYYS